MPGNILLVDDDPKVLEILEKSLTKRGHDVHVASDSREAMDVFNSTDVDMVVLDVILPDGDGRELLQQMRQTKSVPVLFLSGSSDPDVRVNSLDRGADDFLVKPVVLREFNAKVRKILGSYRTTRALEFEVSKRQEDLATVNRELKRQLISMRTLFGITQDLNRRLDTDELIGNLALTLLGELQLSSVVVCTSKGKRRDVFVPREVKGLDRKRIDDLRIHKDSPFTQELLELKRPKKISRTKRRDWATELPDMRLAMFEYATPILVGGKKIRGVVFTGPKINSREYSAFDLEMLKSVCNSAGVGLDNAALFQELQNTYLSTVKTLVSMIEAKDPYTKGHTERVADYAVALGARMQLPREHLKNIAFGAVLHDIGKLVVYEEVLNKEGELTDEEWEAMKEHPVIGAEIIENMPFLGGAVGTVRHHHEQWDGSGYPDGLSGDDIPIGARIVAVTDGFDAMTTDRAYRQAFSPFEALQRLKDAAGTQFDPHVVACFIELIESGYKVRGTKG